MNASPRSSIVSKTLHTDDMSLSALEHNDGVTQVGAGQAGDLPHVGVDHVEGRGGTGARRVVGAAALEEELDTGHGRATSSLAITGYPKNVIFYFIRSIVCMASEILIKIMNFII